MSFRFRCNLARVAPALRVLLASDGTLTQMVEALCGEPVRVFRLSQTAEPAPRRNDALEMDAGEMQISRRVVLQGGQSRINYVYAESRIAAGRLDTQFQQGLMSTDLPMGRLWRDRRIEVHKEIINVWDQPAGSLGKYFGLGEDEECVARTTRVFIGSKPAMLIAEYFPPALEIWRTGQWREAARSA